MSRTNDKEVCGRCDHWRPGKIETGWCHLEGPKVVVVSCGDHEEMDSIWPECQVTDWCGRFINEDDELRESALYHQFTTWYQGQEPKDRTDFDNWKKIHEQNNDEGGGE